MLEKLMAEYPGAPRYRLSLGEVFVSMGWLYNTVGQHTAAEAACRHAIELSPNSFYGHHNLAIVLTNQERYAAAESAYRQAIELKPDEPRSYHNLGIALNRQKRYAEAEAACRRAIVLNPDSPFFWLGLGNVFLDQKRPAEAEAPLKRAMELQPNSIALHIQLGRALTDQGKFPEAEATYVRAANLKPAKGYSRHMSACAAAIAGCFRSNDSRTLADPDRIQLRRQALDLLTTELAVEAKLAETPANRPKVRENMLQYKGDTAFNDLRDAAELAKLPEAERITWQKLWADVAALQKRCEEPPAAAKPMP